MANKTSYIKALNVAINFTHVEENENPKMKENTGNWSPDCIHCNLETANSFTSSQHFTKMEFSMKHLFSKCDQICRKL